MIGELSEPLSVLSELNSVDGSRRRKMIFNLIIWKSSYDIWISHIQKSSYFEPTLTLEMRGTMGSPNIKDKKHYLSQILWTFII